MVSSAVDPADLAGMKTITIKDLHEAISKLVDKWPNVEVYLMAGPTFDEVPLATALAAPEHGALYLIGTPVAQELEDDTIVDAAWDITESCGVAPVEDDDEEVDSSIAESA